MGGEDHLHKQLEQGGKGEAPAQSPAQMPGPSFHCHAQLCVGNASKPTEHRPGNRHIQGGECRKQATYRINVD